MRGSACLCLVLVTAPLFAAELSQFNTCTDRRSMDQLAVVAKKLVTPGHGILAADESISTVGKRLASINVDNSEANRAALRHMLFTSQGIAEYISGVILFEEQLFQVGPDGVPLVQHLTAQGVLLGVKVDTGLVELPASTGEMMTQGLDNLKARCLKYKAAGASFAKWRAVIQIRPAGPGVTALPSEAAIAAAARGLAMYAAICQSAGLVPIVEPEVLSDGAHDTSLCESVTGRVLSAVFKELFDAGVSLEGMLLKPNMILPGSSSQAAPPELVAAATLRVLQRTVPPAVPGIVFLSGGQSEEDATQHLALINKQPGPKPWVLSYSYGRALQASALKSWRGQQENVAAGQTAFLQRAAANSAAAMAS